MTADSVSPNRTRPALRARPGQPARTGRRRRAGLPVLRPRQLPAAQAPGAAARPLAVDRRHRDGLLGGGRARRARPHRPGRAGALLRRAPRLRPGLRPRRQPHAAAGPGGRRLAGTGRRAVQGPGLVGQRGRDADRPARRLVRGRPGAGHPPGRDLRLHHAPAPRGRRGRHGGRRGRRAGRRSRRPAEPGGPARRRDRTRAAQRGAARACDGPATCSTTTTRRRSRPCSAADGGPARTTPCPSPCGRPLAALGDYERAFWTTAQVGGDVDTTCAIVGGVVAAGAASAPPARWLERTEALPDLGPDAAAH